MSAWGPGIFSDDVAADVRDGYRALLEDQVSDDEAMETVIHEYRHLDGDEAHLLWIALAAAQSQLGRLDDNVRALALAVIDEGQGLELWEEAGARDLAKRKAALAELRQRLTGPQPARKAVRRPWRHVTDLLPGSVLAFRATNGQMTLLRVLRIDDDRVGAAPIVEWLDWVGVSPPSEQEISRLKPRTDATPVLAGPARPATYCVSKHRKKDPDWQDCGFVVLAHVPNHPDDERAQAWTLCGWERLAHSMERSLTSRTHEPQ